jgi:hypothetical protein
MRLFGILRGSSTSKAGEGGGEPLPAFGREHSVFDNPRETLKGNE